jgi:hypothetical protein
MNKRKLFLATKSRKKEGKEEGRKAVRKERKKEEKKDIFFKINMSPGRNDKNFLIT